MNRLDIINAIVYGHAIADALGVPVEFTSRNALQRNSVTGMRGYGTHDMPAGTWSDDTSMALATMDSLAGGIDYEDTIRRFCDWMERDAYTATGEMFDIGIITSDALHRYLIGTPALQCGRHGNGSLMRIYPVVLYCCVLHPDEYDTAAMIEPVHNYSALTHAHPRSMVGCGIYAFVLRSLLNGNSVTDGLSEANAFYKASEYCEELQHYSRIFAEDFRNTPMDDIRSGGYVVSSLEAAIWCLMNSKSYSECVLTAVNLGRDTDTVGAITGSLAGVVFGVESIPSEWMDTLLNRELIEHVIGRFTANLQ